MSTLLNEQAQFVSNAGIPIVGGKVYIGDVGADPVLNSQTIYSDRELTTALANPQTIDATGRPANKIWVNGKYSMQVNDINGVQVFQDLDRGVNSSVIGILGLSGVIGGNIITAVASPVITSYTDKLIYIFTAAQSNSGPTTLNIDGIGAKDIVQNNNLALGSGRIKLGDNVVVCYNSTNDNFDIVNQKTNLIAYRTTSIGDNIDPADLGALIDCTADLTLTTTAAATLGDGFSFYVKANGGTVTIDPNAAETIDDLPTILIPNGTKALITCDGSNLHTAMTSPVYAHGADVATAPEALVLKDGNDFDFTGGTTVATIEDTADDWEIGKVITIRSVAAFTMTHSASLSLITEADITTEAGDTFALIKYAAGDWRMQWYQRRDGTSLSPTISPVKAWVNFNGTGTIAINASDNVSSLTDNGVGIATVNFSAVQPDANYSVAGVCVGFSANAGYIISLYATSGTTGAGMVKTTSAVKIMTKHNSSAFTDLFDVSLNITGN